VAKVYRLGPGQRIANAVFRTFTRLGLGARYRYLLTVRGRNSGLPRSTPVDVMTIDATRFLVAPYGEVNWVRNLRAAKELTLSRRGRVAMFAAEEVLGEQAAGVIRAYIGAVPVTRAYWDADEQATDADLARESARHPVFQLTAKP
jgi:deazaflavin-dependent oxidoreductase (nitroreductase family)